MYIVNKILLPVGVSFGSKRIYIARQKDGFEILKYKWQRKYFLEIMNLKEEETLGE